MKFTLILALSLFGVNAFSSTFLINEQALIDLAKQENPNQLQIESSFKKSQVDAMELEDQFGYELYSKYNHQNTKEKGTISFQPVFGNINQYQVGVKKYTKYGVVLDANTGTNVQSGSSESGTEFKDLHTTRHELGIQLDLWKNLMGKVSNAQFKNLKDIEKKDELQSEISEHTFLVNVRRLYWNIVANDLKLKIQEELLIAANKQLADAKSRRANSVSDNAEVAKFESLVYRRTGQVIVKKYERQALFKNLRDLFPSLNGKELELEKYNIDKSVFEVLTCSAQINNQKEIPFEHTKYDDVTKLLRGVQERQRDIDQSYDDFDLKLDLKFFQVGVSSDSEDSGSTYKGDYQDSLNDIADNDRNGFSAGLMFSIPFGENKKATAEVKEKLSEMQLKSNILSLDSNVRATHTQVKSSVLLLADLMKAQKANSKSLQVRVRELKRKFQQARIPEYILIQDQDSLLESDVSVVDTQLRVVNTILDYFAIFNTYPCSFNRK